MCRVLWKIWNAYEKAVEKITYATMIIGAVSLFILMVMITIYIIARKTIGAGNFDATELSGYLMIIVVFLSLAYTFREGGLLRVELIYDRFSPKLKKIVDIILGLLGLSYCYILTKYSFYLVYTSYINGTRSDSTYQIFLCYPQTVITIGAIVLTLTMIEFVVNRFIVLFGGQGKNMVGESKSLDEGGVF